MTKVSRHSYAETIELLTGAMRATGNLIFCVIDQAAAAAAAGMTLRPTALIIFGNPKGGTPLMDAYPLIALDLPLKMLVWEEKGGAYVAYEAPSAIAARYGVTGMDERLTSMDAAVASLAAVVT